MCLKSMHFINSNKIISTLRGQSRQALTHVETRHEQISTRLALSLSLNRMFRFCSQSSNEHASASISMNHRKNTRRYRSISNVPDFDTFITQTGRNWKRKTNFCCKQWKTSFNCAWWMQFRHIEAFLHSDFVVTQQNTLFFIALTMLALISARFNGTRKNKLSLFLHSLLSANSHSPPNRFNCLYNNGKI